MLRRWCGDDERKLRGRPSGRPRLAPPPPDGVPDSDGLAGNALAIDSDPLFPRCVRLSARRSDGSGRDSSCECQTHTRGELQSMGLTPPSTQATWAALPARPRKGCASAKKMAPWRLRVRAPRKSDGNHRDASGPRADPDVPLSPQPG